MRVRREDLGGTQIQRLVVTDPRDTDHHPGECAGYLCPECLQADETLDQIYHNESCALAGEHGRAHYDELEPDVDRDSPELDEAHPITVVESAETDGGDGFRHGEVIAFRCQCGNLDENAFEVVHDQACPLAEATDGPLTDTSAVRGQLSD